MENVKKSKFGADTDANLSLPTYSFADYCIPSPAVVYTCCDEADKLVETFEIVRPQSLLPHFNTIHSPVIVPTNYSPLGFDLRGLLHSG